MKGLSRLLRSDKIIKWGLGFSLVLLMSETAYILLFLTSLPPVIPLYNQMPWGETRLGSRTEIFLPIGITAAFLLLNFFILTRLYEKMPLLSRMLSITALLITTLSFIFVIRTLQLIL